MLKTMVLLGIGAAIGLIYKRIWRKKKVSGQGDMKMKYERLVSFILESNKRLIVGDCGLNSIDMQATIRDEYVYFRIVETTKDVIVTLNVKRNVVLKSTLKDWYFDKELDQEVMITEINADLIELLEKNSK